MPRRLVPAEPAAVVAALDRVVPRLRSNEPPSADDLALLTRHFLALLARAAPGRSVEVRVPPYAAIQCVAGPRHTRGTPPAVVELDSATWVMIAIGSLPWGEALAAGRLIATGERTDLTGYLPLHSPAP